MRGKSKRIEMNIDRVDFPNKGIGIFEDKEVKVKGGIEGQRVAVNLTRRRKGYVEGKILEVLEPSELETEMGCPHKDVCGGCTYQALTLEAEKTIKLEQIKRLFEKNGIDVEIEEYIESPVVIGYRNKMEYSFGDEEKDGPLALGLRRKGRFYEVVNTDYCNIVHSDFTLIRQAVLKYFKDLETPYYNKRTHIGYLRHLVIRRTSTGSVMINLVTSSQGKLYEGEFKDLILTLKLEGSVECLIHTINDSLGDVVKSDKETLLFGKYHIEEKINGLKFEISPYSFFQTNTYSANELYRKALEYAGNKKRKVIYDLYSGTGTIAQMLSTAADKVIGVEIVEEAVEKARENAKLNELSNVEFIKGDVMEVMENLEDTPELIVIDPPRDGIHPKAINKLISFNPKEYIYISCNPVTLVRDLQVFLEEGYNIEKIALVNQFPRTPHVETVCLLTRK